MPSYGGRRYFRIVAPPSRAKEISGGIKNALDRGEPLAKAKQSFLNAGYKIQEVNEATQMIGRTPSGLIKPLNPQTHMPAQASPTQLKKPTTGMSKKTIIILVIVAVVILGAALFLGLFWNKIF